MENNVRKFYVDADGMVNFVCPKCGDVKKEQAQMYKGVKMPIKVECRCGQANDVQVEFRKLYRKETKLEGIYTTAANPERWGKIIVTNMSLEGCGFETKTANLLKSEEEIEVEFKLDNIKTSRIKKRAVVRFVRGHYVGCKFKELPGAIDPDLGFYLRRK